MKKSVSDTEIRARVRSILAHYRLDLQHVHMTITGGTVRITGRLAFLTGGRDAVPVAVVEGLERDLGRAQGIRQLYFDLVNWRRVGPGEWVSVHANSGGILGQVLPLPGSANRTDIDMASLVAALDSVV